MGEAAPAWEGDNVRSLSPDDQRLHLRMLEAILFAAREPMTEAEIARRMPEGTDIPVLLLELRAAYAGRGVNLRRIAASWAFRTAEDLAFALKREVVEEKKLSRAALETLAIVAYHQPVTRADIEEIRGVSISKGTLDVLLEAGWIRLRGRRRTPGRPVTFGTTPHFLDQFGLESISDLPGLADLKAAGLLESIAATGDEPQAPDDNPSLAEDEDPLEFDFSDFGGDAEDAKGPAEEELDRG